MKKLLIIGSNGMLGKDVASFFLGKKDYEVYGINRKKDLKIKDGNSYVCDIRNEDKLNLLLDEVNPDIIIHCAAIVNVDECEEDKEGAFIVNAKSAKVLSSYNPHKTKFVYISTDSVFDGNKGNYNEYDNVNPLNYYAESKLAGENFTMGMNNSALVIRANIYGFHEQEGSSLVEWALKNLRVGNKISGFYDVFFNPLYTKQLAQIVYDLINIDCKGVVNAACGEFVSKYEFLLMLSEVFNIDKDFINKDSVKSINFKTERPKNTTLNISKLKNLLGYKVNLRDGLEELNSDYYKYF